MTPDPTDELHITVQGRTALTLRQAARHTGFSESALRGELTRLKQAGHAATWRATLSDGSEPIGERSPLFWPEQLDEALSRRPRGATPGKPRGKTVPPVTTPAVP